MLSFGAILLIPLIVKQDENEITTSDSTDLQILKDLNYKKINDFLKDLGDANIAFNTPETIRVAETKTIALLLSQKHTTIVLEEQLKSTLSDPGVIHADTVKISTTMEASLAGQGFSILSITPIKQIISSKEITEWKWAVTANDPGLKKLYLTLNVIIKHGDSKELHTIRRY